MEERTVVKGDVMTNEHDDINHPGHYTYSEIEPIDVIEAWGLGFHAGNALKYLARAGHKGGPGTEVRDIKKAIWYLERLVWKQQARSKHRRSE